VAQPVESGLVRLAIVEWWPSGAGCEVIQNDQAAGPKPFWRADRRLLGLALAAAVENEQVVPFMLSPLNCLSGSADHRCDGFPNSMSASTRLAIVVRSPSPPQRHGYVDRDGKITTARGPQPQCGAVQLVA